MAVTRGYRYTVKPCKQCGSLEKRRNKDGVSLGCLPCKNKDARERMAAWRKLNPEKSRRQVAEWRKKNPDGVRSHQLKKLFGIDLKRYEEMLVQQGGACAICRGHNKSGKRLAVDHDHESGQVRSLLCSNCNTALGGFRDSATVCRLAAEYLERWGR